MLKRPDVKAPVKNALENPAFLPHYLPVGKFMEQEAAPGVQQILHFLSIMGYHWQMG
jgi:hypothetical protein